MHLEGPWSGNPASAMRRRQAYQGNFHNGWPSPMNEHELLQQVQTAKGRAFPLGLQHIYTNLSCASFAHAMISHPCCEGGTIVEFATRDPRHTGDVRMSGETAYVHTAILLPTGEFLDVEGRRTIKELCAAFKMKASMTRCSASADQSPSDSDEARLLRKMADILGWEAGAPAARDIRTVTVHRSEGEDEFWERLGGMASSPEQVITKAMMRLQRYLVAEAESGWSIEMNDDSRLPVRFVYDRADEKMKAALCLEDDGWQPVSHEVAESILYEIEERAEAPDFPHGHGLQQLMEMPDWAADAPIPEKERRFAL